MFCECGTFLRKNKEEDVTCHRCNLIHSSNSFKSTIITKTYAQPKDIKYKKAVDAKIKHKCNKCGNNEMTYNTIQIRSVDEGQTVFYECECGYKENIHS